jgi:predicted DCC family thiol-disulfide oxidoreductase YuxK
MSERPVVIFDGYCNLCSGTVRFFSRRNSNRSFRFLAGQSTEGIELLKKYDLASPETIVFIDAGKVYAESTAVLRMSAQLGYPWKFISYLKIIPVSIRDAIYRIMARNRYTWFGKRKTCANNIG